MQLSFKSPRVAGGGWLDWKYIEMELWGEGEE